MPAMSFKHLLKTYGIECSMSRKGDCWDNAVAESFFHTLKVELIHVEKLTILVRKPRRLFLNILKGFTIGNAAIHILVISVQMSTRKRMWLN